MRKDIFAVTCIAAALLVALPERAAAAEVKCPAPQVSGGMALGGERVPDLSCWNGFVSLRIPFRTGPPKDAYFCGGFVIGAERQWIVTAAHCFQNGSMWAIDPATGAMSSPNDWQGQKFEVAVPQKVDLKVAPPPVILPWAKIVLHHRYSDVHKGDDIALIKLKSPAPATMRALDWSADVATDPGAPGAPTSLYITGFGRTTPDPDDENAVVDVATQYGRRVFAGSDLLKQAKFPEMDRKLCQQRWAEPGGPKILDSQLCMGSTNPLPRPVDSCSGDSGGPLIYWHKKGDKIVPYVVGLVSYGMLQCGVTNRPGVYTRMSSHAAWIKSVVGGTATPGPLVAQVERTDAGESAGLAFSARLDARSGFATPTAPSVDVMLGDKSSLKGAKPDVRIGDVAEVKIRSAKLGGHLLLFDVDADGNVTYLYPNAFTGEAQKIKAGEKLTVGGDQDKFQFRAGPPLGKSYLIAVVTTDKSLIDRLELKQRTSRIAGGYEFNPTAPESRRVQECKNLGRGNASPFCAPPGSEGKDILNIVETVMTAKRIGGVEAAKYEYGVLQYRIVQEK